MKPDTFQADLQRDGFAEIDTRSLPPGQFNPTHSHPFEVRAMVLDGEITLTYDGATHVYRSGDVFSMAPGCEHAEQVGGAGVSYMVGRRH
jgi:quercetin dioxygenase-like cupin family protein